MLPFLLPIAAAQSFDATGIALPPDGAGARDPVTTFGGRPFGAGSISLTMEGASGILQRVVMDGPYVRTEPVVDGLVGATLGGTIGFARKWGVGATVPAYLLTLPDRSTGALGDIRVWGAYSFVYEPRRYGVSLHPYLKLPTGSKSLYTTSGFGGGVLVSGAFHAGLLSTSADLGLDLSAAQSHPDWASPATFFGSAAVGVAGEKIGAHLEIRGRTPLSSVFTVPSESFVTVKASPLDKLWFTLGGGVALTRGPGAGAPRIFLGVSYSLAKKGEDPEAAPPPPKVDIQELYVVDQRRFPIANVKVTVGEESFLTGGEGFADIPIKVFEKDRVLTLEHPAYITVERRDLTTDDPFWQLVMDRAPIPVAVSVVGPDGEPMLDSQVEMRSMMDPPLDAGLPRVDGLGVHHWSLPPGSKWVAVMTAEQMGGQARVIDIQPERVEPIRVDAVLDLAVDPTTKLTVKVIDGLGVAVEDAAVAIQNREFGTTGPGGMLEIRGLPRGEHAVTVRSPLYGEANVADVTVDDDANVQVVLEWPAGAVLTKVSNADGQPLDATVSFSGPGSIPPRQIGSDGQELFALRPGVWTLEISKDGLGSQARTIEVDDNPGVFRELAVVLAPEPEPGGGELVVKVIDVRGDPIPDVTITLDGEPVGTTGSTGNLTLLNLGTGTRLLAAKGELLVPELKDVELSEGRQVVNITMGHVPGVVDITATRDGQPVDLTIEAKGDLPRPPIDIGADGRERMVLTPGTWEIKATDDTGKEQTKTVVVPLAPVRTKVAFEIGDGVASADDAAEQVQMQLSGPEGPVRGEIQVFNEQGMALSRTLEKGRNTVDLPPGEYEVVATNTDLGTKSFDIEIKPDGKTKPIDLTLKSPGDIVFALQDVEGRPVSDAVVMANGKEVGKTSESGTVTLKKVPKTATLEVTPDGAFKPLQIPADAAAGNTYVVEDAARAVNVAIEGGAPAGTRITVSGQDGSSVETDAEGLATLQLTPGTFTVTATRNGQVAVETIEVPRSGQAPEVRLRFTGYESRVLGNKIAVPSPILFDLDKSDIRTDIGPLVDDAALLMLADRSLALIEIGGHTDDQGGSVYNQALSERRADAVRLALIARGVEPERLVRRGYGLSRPIAEGDENRARNRRVELTILERVGGIQPAPAPPPAPPETPEE